MHRRDLLKTLPLSFAGMAELAGINAGGWTNSAVAPGEPLVAQVKLHNGAPTMFLNGEPVFAGMCWVVTSLANWWAETEKTRAVAKAGIHWYSLDAGKDYEWVEPKGGGSDPFDFSTVEARYGRIIDIDPLARFHIRLHFEFQQDDWWMKAYPAEAEISSEGKAVTQSFASAVWRQQTNDFIRVFIAHLKRIGLLDRITAFQPGAGHTGEWVKGETSMYWLCGDYGEPMRRYFRAWLRRQYHDDVSEFQAAWNNPKTTFETAEVPTAEEQLQAKLYTFRDPARERNVIDYHRCFADLSGDLVVDFCRTVKEATEGKKLAGAFYGYLMELAWNGGFFGERQDSDYSTYQRGGHLGLGRFWIRPTWISSCVRTVMVFAESVAIRPPCSPRNPHGCTASSALLKMTAGRTSIHGTIRTMATSTRFPKASPCCSGTSPKWSLTARACGGCGTPSTRAKNPDLCRGSGTFAKSANLFFKRTAHPQRKLPFCWTTRAFSMKPPATIWIFR